RGCRRGATLGDGGARPFGAVGLVKVARLLGAAHPGGARVGAIVLLPPPRHRRRRCCRGTFVVQEAVLAYARVCLYSERREGLTDGQRYQSYIGTKRNVNTHPVCVYV
ncbi:unnamed protein product, partial [Ectocarpus sp. 12 AP-2014]